jgi:hypothetical protein
MITIMGKIPAMHINCSAEDIVMSNHLAHSTEGENHGYQSAYCGVLPEFHLYDRWHHCWQHNYYDHGTNLSKENKRHITPCST